MKDTFPSDGLVEDESTPPFSRKEPRQPTQPKVVKTDHASHDFAGERSIGAHFLFGITRHSKLLSIRNGFGITPKGPVGPSPPRAPRRRGPSVPLGTLGFPWVPVGPTLRDRHLVEATERRLESLVAERLYRRDDTGSAACA